MSISTWKVLYFNRIVKFIYFSWVVWVTLRIWKRPPWSEHIPIWVHKTRHFISTRYLLYYEICKTYYFGWMKYIRNSIINSKLTFIVKPKRIYFLIRSYAMSMSSSYSNCDNSFPYEKWNYVRTYNMCVIRSIWDSTLSKLIWTKGYHFTSWC